MEAVAGEARRPAASTSYEAGRARAAIEPNVPRGVRQPLEDLSAVENTGGVLECEVLQPIVVCHAAVSAQREGCTKKQTTLASAEEGSAGAERSRQIRAAVAARALSAAAKACELRVATRRL